MTVFPRWLSPPPTTVIFVADVDDVQPWTAAGVKTPAFCPGCGCLERFSDRLAALGSKSTDLLRVGRQPAAYEDDEATAAPSPASWV